MQRLNPKADRLRTLIARDDLLVVPCCHDGLSAKLIEQAGFEMTFVSGFATAASRVAQPDLGLMSYGEVLDHVRNIAEATTLPFAADADTGYGNAMNVKRTVKGMASAGAAAVMLEDQVAPKRCGHLQGKSVVPRDIACDRIKAAVDARENDDILILARTDARYTHGLAEAIDRANAFHDLGADILFVEAPQSIEEMEAICQNVSGPLMANMLRGGVTPILPHQDLQDLGYRIAVHPFTALASAMKAIVDALDALKADRSDPDALMEFQEIQRRLGVGAYLSAAEEYKS